MAIPAPPGYIKLPFPVEHQLFVLGTNESSHASCTGKNYCECDASVNCGVFTPFVKTLHPPSFSRSDKVYLSAGLFKNLSAHVDYSTCFLAIILASTVLL